MKKRFVFIIVCALIAVSMISCEKQPKPEDAIWCSRCDGTGTIWPGVGIFKILPSDCPDCSGKGYIVIDWMQKGGNVSFRGKHCNGTVGCSCPGFEPITNGKVWETQYCKHCGHHKKYHK